MTEFKKTAFYKKEKEMNARFTEFGEWELPIRYSSQIEEHLCVRDGVGVFDVSHMGEIIIEGKNALKQVNYLVTNDCSTLENGDILYTPMMNKKGGCVDDFLVYRFNENKYFLVVNASNIQKDFSWMKENNKYNANIENLSDNYSQLAIQGKDSQKVLNELFKEDLSNILYYKFRIIKYLDKELIVSRTGYTGEDGFEIYLPKEISENLWDELFLVGKKYNLKPIGLGARDTLRLEKKMALYGHELSDEISPIEAGLKWTVKKDKEEFIGKEFIENNKIRRKIVGIELIDKGIPRNGDLILNLDNEEIGFVTSGTKSPSLNKAIALIMVKKKFAKLGTELQVSIRSKLKKAIVVKTPFV